MADLPNLTCPRCQGRLLRRRDAEGAVRACLACGYVHETDSPPERPAAPSLNRRPTHGKGKRRFRL